MSRKRHSVDQIIGKLRQADVELGQGKTVEEACRALEITVQTYYRWRHCRLHAAVLLTPAIVRLL